MSFLEDFDPDEDRVTVMEMQAERERDAEVDKRLAGAKCPQCGKQYWSRKWFAKHLAAHKKATNEL